MVYMRFKRADADEHIYFVGTDQKAVLDDTKNGTNFGGDALTGEYEQLDSERVLALIPDRMILGDYTYRDVFEHGVRAVKSSETRSLSFFLFTI